MDVLKRFVCDWNFWVSIVTAATAVASIIYVQKQIKLSNNQFLYDRRFKLYRILLQLKDTFEEHSENLQRNGEASFNGLGADFL